MQRTQHLGFNGIFLNALHLNCHKSITGVQSLRLSIFQTLNVSASDSSSVCLMLILSICLFVPPPPPLLLTGPFAGSDTRLLPSYLFRQLTQTPRKQQA